MMIPKSIAKGMLIVGAVGIFSGAGYAISHLIGQHQALTSTPMERLEEIVEEQEELEDIGQEYETLGREAEEILNSDEYLTTVADMEYHNKQVWNGLKVELFSGLFVAVPGYVAIFRRRKEEKEEQENQIK